MEEYLNSIVGKRLFQEEKKELISKIDLRRDGKQMKSYDSFNSCFKESNLHYIIIPKIIKLQGKTKRCWIVEKTLIE